ncbi:MAG: citrate synthase [Thermodesulfobacteriota bacterium]
MESTTGHRGRSRGLAFVRRPVTRIWQEKAAADNPYLATACRCHGYDLFELARKRGWVEVLFLLFRGELPRPEQAQLLERLMVACIHPGPRHPATWAVMNAAVSRTDPVHLLPIGLEVLGGSQLGAAEVGAAMRFQVAHGQEEPAKVAREFLGKEPRPAEGDWHPVPGFGSRFGGVDPLARQLAAELGTLPAAGAGLRWGAGLAATLEEEGLGWLPTGVVAASLGDLGFSWRAGVGLYQIFSAPGILASGLEMASQPVTAMPFLDDEGYCLAAAARKPV